MKLLRLRHTVLADGGVQDEQDLMWSAFVLAGDHPFDLHALLHEIHFGVELTCGIDDHHIGTARLSGLDGVINDGRGMAPAPCLITSTPTRSA
jgi:hypothetical protein